MLRKHAEARTAPYKACFAVGKSPSESWTPTASEQASLQLCNHTLSWASDYRKSWLGSGLGLECTKGTKGLQEGIAALSWRECILYFCTTPFQFWQTVQILNTEHAQTPIFHG